MLTLNIELDGVKHSVRKLLETHHSEMGVMVNEEVERQITQDWVQDEIRRGVTECIKDVTKSLTNDYRLRDALKTAMIDQLLKDS